MEEQNGQKDIKKEHNSLIEEKSKTSLITTLLIIVLIISAGVLGFLYFQQLNAKRTVEKERQELLQEFTGLSDEYELLLSENDTINLRLIKRQIEIQKIIKEITQIKRSNGQIIRQYKKELGTLRDIMKSYIVQIDSLNTKNEALISENKDVKAQIEKVKGDLKTEKEIKDSLTLRVEMGRKLTAKEIVAVALSETGKEKNRISKIARFRVCFTIRENPIAEPGPRMIYMRINRPDNVVLSDSEENVFELNENKFLYSDKREIEYENQDLAICIFWQNNGMLIPGTYKFDLYTNENILGSTTMVIK